MRTPSDPKLLSEERLWLILVIFQAGSRYSFRSYFELPYDTDEILAEFGYRFQRAYLDRPRSQAAIPQTSQLK